MSTCKGPPSLIATGTGPAPERWPLKGLVAYLPGVLVVIGAVLSVGNRLSVVETCMRDVERRMDRFEGKLDRLIERPAPPSARRGDE